MAGNPLTEVIWRLHKSATAVVDHTHVRLLWWLTRS